MTATVQPTPPVSAARFMPARTGHLRSGRRLATLLHARLLLRTLALPSHLVDLLRPDADDADLAQQVLVGATRAA